MTSPRLSPIERSVAVSWDPATAFHRFTSQFETWWPSGSFSIGGERIKRIVFEPGAGGLIFEEHTDGRRFQWGEVTEWTPPMRVAFSWHPSRNPENAQTVVVEFFAQGSGTLVKLTSSGWENWGEGAEGARKGYGAGWGYILNHWAGRRTGGMLALDGAMGMMKLLQVFRGGRNAVIAKAEGEIQSA